MAESNNKLHVVMFPWLGFGHLIPFLELAKQIARKGHKVSFLGPPKIIKRLSQDLSSPLLDLVALPLPRLDDLPEDAEATIDVWDVSSPYVEKAYDRLEPAVAGFLESSSPDWVIHDFVSHWLPPSAAKLGIPCAFFGIGNAWSMGFFGSMVNDAAQGKTLEDFIVAPKWVSFESNIRFRPHELRKMSDSAKENPPSEVSGQPSEVTGQVRFSLVNNGCDVLLLRTCEELESDWLKVLGEKEQKTILPVGFLPPSVEDRMNDEDEAWQKIIKWLDKQKKESVVYVAFGTEATLSQSELKELALGLELSGLPFFWTLRKRPAAASSSHSSDTFELPDGFEERTKGRGMVWTSWAPQLKILAHNSVGGFLTHCGWSSIIEGLQHGRPLIMFPILGDQGLNARALEEKKVGLEIPRDESDGSFTRDSVAKSVSLVMVEEQGKIYRDKAKVMSSIIGDRGLQEHYLDNLLNYFQNRSSQHKALK